MRAFLDGAASFLAALASLAISGLPCWFTFKAIQATVAPQWAWVAVAALGGVGLLLTFAFLGKAAKGIAPSRSRRRG